MAKDANFQLGFMFFLRRDYPSAAPYFERTVAVDSTFVPALQNLALCRLQMGQKSEAIETLRRSLAVRPNDARAMIWIGQTMLTMEPDSLPVALDVYRSAIEVDSSNADAYRGAGLAMLLMDNCAESQGYFEKAKEMDPGHVQGHIWLAQAYSKCKDQTRAKMEFNEALQIDPENREASRGLDIIRKWEQQQLQRAQGQDAGGTGGTTP